jgi:RNA polymerase sigma-70 factor (ECF subfamily)
VQRVDDNPQIIRRIAQGDEAALGDLYDRYSRPVYAMVLRMVRSEVDAEEIVQDVFLTVWRSARSFDAERAKVFTWVVTVARNRAIDRIRSIQRRQPAIHAAAAPEPLDTDGTPLHSAMMADEARRLSDFVEALPVNQCLAIQLAFFEGMTHPEIAARLGETIGTVKAQIRLGMEKLRQKVKGRTR